MEAGLTDHVWSIAEMVGLLSRWGKKNDKTICTSEPSKYPTSNTATMPWLILPCPKSFRKLVISEPLGLRSLMSSRISDLSKLRHYPKLRFPPVVPREVTGLPQFSRYISIDY